MSNKREQLNTQILLSINMATLNNGMIALKAANGLDIQEFEKVTTQLSDWAEHLSRKSDLLREDENDDDVGWDGLV